MVERYGMIDEASGYSPVYFGETPDGNYVRYSDYAQLERDLADTRERSAEWAQSFARKCVEAVALETENSRLQSEYASLLETVTRKVNEKIEAERDLAEARAEIERWAEQALKEEDCRKMWQAECDRFAAEVENLPFSVRDIKRGLILFRTSNNAHDYTNFVSLTAKVDALPQVAKDELAQLMRVIADGLSPARASLQTGEKGE